MTEVEQPKRKRKRWRRRLARVVVLTFIGWLVGGLVATWLLVHRPRPMFAEPAPEIEGIDVREHRLTTRDGETLGAWLVAGEPDKPVAILIHGMSDCRTSWRPLLENLARRGFGVAAVSLRSHGDSTGGWIDIGYSSAADVVATVDLVERELPGRSIVIVAASMGSAASLFAAKELGTRVSGYLLESPYSDLETATKNRLKSFTPPGISHACYVGMRLWAGILMPTDPDLVRPVDAAVHVPASAPVVILSGDEDHYATLDEAQAIANRVPGGATIIHLPKGGHGRLIHENPDAYRKALYELLGRAVMRGTIPPTTVPVR